jgi:5-methylcytosine-specific restriction enzyme subunit McrC
MTEPLVLREGRTQLISSLNASELTALRTLVPSLRISPSLEGAGFDITPGAVIGAVRLGDRSVLITPKIPMRRVLFLLAYALDPRVFRATDPELERDDDPLAVIAPIFIRWTNHAIARGLLQGYKTTFESSMTVRGRIRFDDQMRRRGSLLLPIEVTYDDFTTDIIENQLLTAAVDLLRHLRLRSDHYRRQLNVIDARLQSVPLRRFGRDLPDPPITRLNRRYEPALALARLILNHASMDLQVGALRCSSLLFDMNRLFEDFVTVALRESLGLDGRAFPQNARRQRLRLDAAEHVALRPDLSWWVDGRPVFVGDVKYKRIAVEGIENADLYQLLAYTVATQLPGGLLIYAAGEAGEVTHTVAANGKELHVRTIDISREPEQVIRRVDELAQMVRGLARLAIAQPLTLD